MPSAARYICPAGQYQTKGKVRSDRRDNIDHYRNLTACPTCTLKPRCTFDKFKRVKRDPLDLSRFDPSSAQAD